MKEMTAVDTVASGCSGDESDNNEEDSAGNHGGYAFISVC